MGHSVNAAGAELATLQSDAAASFAYYGGRVGWGIAHTSHRDADTLTRANHAAAWEALSAIASPGTLARETFRHWAVGWTEVIIVRPGSAAWAEAIALRARLDDYPVLDEDAFADLEWSEEWCVRCDRGTRADHPLTYHGAASFLTRCPFRSAEDAAEIAEVWRQRCAALVARENDARQTGSL